MKKAAEPHLVSSAREANTLLAELQAHISDLRLKVSELELEADLYYNLLMKDVCEKCNGKPIICERCKGKRTNGKSIPLKESEYKISSQYREWKQKAGLLQDVRAIRRNLERHADLLLQQEKYNRPQAYLG